MSVYVAADASAAVLAASVYVFAAAKVVESPAAAYASIVPVADETADEIELST